MQSNVIQDDDEIVTSEEVPENQDDGSVEDLLDDMLASNGEESGE
jgi:hypothetical protein